MVVGTPVAPGIGTVVGTPVAPGIGTVVGTAVALGTGTFVAVNVIKGVESIAVAVVAPDAMPAPLLISVTVAELFTVTAKTTLPIAPGSSVPTSNVQGLMLQFHPGVLAPALKVVSTGIASVRVTGCNVTLPVF